MTNKRGLAALILAGVLMVTALSGCGKKKEENKLILDYATGTVEVEDADALQKAFDEAVEQAKEDQIALNYKNDAYSQDGRTFSCYIGNSTMNTDDIFIMISKDGTEEGQLYLSGLLRPGTAIDSVRLDERLAPGNHMLYVAFTKVQLIDGEQTITGQAIVTMDFHVEP